MADFARYQGRPWHQKIHDLLFNRRKKKRIYKNTLERLCSLIEENRRFAAAAEAMLRAHEHSYAETLKNHGRQIATAQETLRKTVEVSDHALRMMQEHTSQIIAIVRRNQALVEKIHRMGWQLNDCSSEIADQDAVLQDNAQSIHEIKSGIKEARSEMEKINGSLQASAMNLSDIRRDIGKTRQT